MINHKDTTDGPTAFPIDRPGYTTLGMTLRDFFASKALGGILSRSFGSKDYPTRTEIVASCYRYADAMLAVREK